MSRHTSAVQSAALPFFILFLIYGASRLPLLLELPIFNDEAIYLRWADIIRENRGELLVSAMDGKTPLFMWLCAIAMSFFDDPLRAGRTVSLLAGFMGLWGIYRLGARWFGAPTAALAAAIYLVLPFTVTYDRMALADTLANTLAIWAMYYAALYAEAPGPRFRPVVLLGFALGLGFLAKTPLLMFCVAPPVTLWLLDGEKNIKAWIGLIPAYGIALALVLPYLLYDPPMRVHGVNKILHNAKLLTTTQSLLAFQHPFFFGNCKKFAGAMTAYVSWPVLLLLAAAILRAFKTRDRRAGLLLFWLLMPAALFLLLLGSEFYARYFLLCLPPLILLAAKALTDLLRWMTERLATSGAQPPLPRYAAIGAVTVAVLSPAAIKALPFISSPLEAAWTEKDRWQYTRSQYSGYGVPEAAQFLAQVAKEAPVAVFFSETWGIPGDALYLYLKNVPNLKTYEAWWAYSMPIFPRNLKDVPIYRSKFEKSRQEIFEMKNLNGKQVFFVERGPLTSSLPLFFDPNAITPGQPDRMATPSALLNQNPNLDLIRSYNRLEDDGYAFSIYKLNTTREARMTPAATP